MRWEDQPLHEVEAFRLMGSPDYGRIKFVMALLGRADAVDAIEAAARPVRERLHAGAFSS